MRRTKIISTFGPSIADPKILKEVCKFSDVIRINLAHGTWDESENIIIEEIFNSLIKLQKLNKACWDSSRLRGQQDQNWRL